MPAAYYLNRLSIKEFVVKLLKLSLLIITFLLASCADQIVESTDSIDEGNEEIMVVAKFSDIQENIFNQSCAFSGCHVGGSVSPDLSGNSFSKIVNQRSSAGIDYIEPNDPGNSYLLQKIIGSNSINGSRMPLSSAPLSQSQIDVVTEWINSGAPNN